MISDNRLVELALDDLRRRKFGYDFLLNVKIFHDPKVCSTLHYQKKGDREYFFRREHGTFMDIDENEHDTLIGEITSYIFSFAWRNKDELGLIVVLYSGNRMEGVGFDVEIISGEPRIIEDSIDIVCMLKAG